MLVLTISGAAYFIILHFIYGLLELFIQMIQECNSFLFALVYKHEGKGNMFKFSTDCTNVQWNFVVRFHPKCGNFYSEESFFFKKRSLL